MLTVALILPIYTCTLCSRTKVLVNNLTGVQHVEHSQIVTECFAERIMWVKLSNVFFQVGGL